MPDVELEAQAHGAGFPRALPHSFGASDGGGGLLCAGSRSLAMKNKRQADAALRPVTFDGAMIRGNPSIIGSANGTHIEMESGSFLGERGYFDAVNALIQAIDGGFEGAVLGL